MNHFYFDASALFKRYHDEAGSIFINALFDQSHQNGYVFYTSMLTGIEFCSAIRRHQREGGVDAETAEAIIQTFLLESEKTLHTFQVDHQIIQLAMTLISIHPLKAYDAVQLATCLEAKRIFAHNDLIYFVCDDNQLREAGRMEGVKVLNCRVDTIPVSSK
jgi:predicted nucleic acid-binding protein